jgi:DNA-binding transcriptional ArsR family regulator
VIDLQFVVASFHKAKWSELALMHEIDFLLRENPISCLTVGKDVWMFVWASRKPDAPILRQSEGAFTVGNCITRVPSEELFLSARQIAKKVMMSKSTVRRHLTQGMQWKRCHLEWVPHIITESGKVKQVQTAREPLELLI